MSFVIRDATTVDIPNIIEAYQWLFQSPGGVPPGWDETRARESIAETIEDISPLLDRLALPEG